MIERETMMSCGDGKRKSASEGRKQNNDNKARRSETSQT